jgi:hypothetical protein
VLRSIAGAFDAKVMSEPIPVSIDYDAIIATGGIVLGGLAIGFLCFMFRHRQGFRVFWNASVTAIWTILALLLLLFGLALFGYGCVQLTQLIASGHSQTPTNEIIAMPIMGLLVTVPCLYLLGGTQRRFAIAATVASGTGLALGVLLFLLGLASLHVMENKDELNAGLGVSSYYALLLIGVLLKRAGVWYKSLPSPAKGSS